MHDYFSENFDVATPSGNDLNLGFIAGKPGQKLQLPADARSTHLYVCGGTGTGKSKFLENLIRQDILSWRKSKCGVLVLDPHGSLYDDLTTWMAYHRLERPVIPIDLRRPDWIISYNLLRKRPTADPAVIVDNLVEAMAFVWGASGTDQTPLFARWAGNIMQALYENGHTLVESIHLLGQPDLRRAMTVKLQDRLSVRDWQFANSLSMKDFEAQVSSTVNRLQRFIRNNSMRCMFGQPNISLDLGTALDEGAIILVSLATGRARVSKENASLFATLLLHDLWIAAQERGKKKNVKPFYVYIDEFQRFVSPTIAQNLDEARGFGLHLTMAHQFPKQLINAGEHGKRLYDSIMENARTKVVFALSDPENLQPLAHALFMGAINPDRIKRELYSTKVMGYREEYRTAYGTSRSSSESHTEGDSTASGDGTVGSMTSNADGEITAEMESWNSHIASTSSSSESWSESEGTSETRTPMLIPVMGQELTHVQYMDLNEQLFRAMAVLFDQKQRQCVVRSVDMRVPVSMFTPNVTECFIRPESVDQYVQSHLAKLPYALRLEAAKQGLVERERYFETHFIRDIEGLIVDEPTTTKRRIKDKPDTGG